jgi:hypothetical protein
MRLFPVTADEGIDVHVSASYFQAQGVRQLQLIFFSLYHFLWFLIFIIKKITFQKPFATYQFAKR